MANEFIARNGLIAQNNSIITGSLTVTNGITGSLFGTASLSLNAISASFSTTSSYNITSSLTPTSSYAVTASLAQSVEFEGKPLSAGWPGNYLFPFKFTTPNVSLAAGSQLDATSNIRYYPIQLSRDTLISSIGALVRSVATPGTTGSYRLGIYNSVKVSTPLVQGSTTLPGKLLGDYGLISQIGTATAFAQIAISDINRPTLKKGEIYWLAISPSGSTTQAATGTNNTLWNDYFGIAPSTTTIASYVGLSVPANGGAALPNPANTASISLLGPGAVKPFPILKITGSIK